MADDFDHYAAQTQLALDNRSPTIAKLADALAKAQKAFAPIPKDREVTVQSTKGNYKFKYATLDAIRTATMPALAEQGLALVQGMAHDHNGNPNLETTLYHSSGEWLRNVTPMFISGRRTADGRDLPPSNQELGSAQTYARRYGISALLCITADEDDDGNTADGNHIEGSQRVPYNAKPKSSWGAGGKAAAVAEAAKDGIIKTPAQANGAAQSVAAKKIADWTNARVSELNSGEWDRAGLDAYWEKHEQQIKFVQDDKNGFKAEYERFNNAYGLAEERL